MLKILKVLLCIFICFNSTKLSGTNAHKVLLDSYWKDITLANTNDSVLVSDTMSVLYSTRKFDPNKIDFFDEIVDPNGKITIVLAVCKNLKWKVYVCKSLDNACAFLPKKNSFLFYVEGFGKNFPLTMFRSSCVSNLYQNNVVLFDYPSYNTSIGVLPNYYRVKKTAKNSAPAFVEFLKSIESSNFIKIDWLFNTNNVLFFHSMGNLILKEMVQKDFDSVLKSGTINRLVLNNPCVSSYKHQKWIDKITFTDQIFIHHNPADKQLKGASFLEGQKILGRFNSTPKSKKAIYINFEPLVGDEHNAFFNKPGLQKIPDESFNYYNALFQGKSFPFSWFPFLKTTENPNCFYLKEVL